MKRLSLIAGVACLGLLAVDARATELAATKVTVLAGEKTVAIERAMMRGTDLLVPVGDVPAITGFEVKPQGLCTAEVCIPMPKDAGWLTDYKGAAYFNVTAFAKRMNQVFAVDPSQNVWSFTPVPEAQASRLASGEAPDFALPDRDGKTVRLSDFRGKKVLILTWASWCGCRFDLAGWEKVYQDLKNEKFEIIAAAQDTGGPKIANPWYDKAHVTYTALVDAQHTVSSLYQMVNVPTGVWIDETGKIVRPPEVAYSKSQRVLGQTIGDDRYAIGLADWVKNGARSEYVVSPEKVRSRLAVRSVNERLADAHFKLGCYFSAADKRELATEHWQQSQKLNPDDWNYHRQDWSFDKSNEMTNFLAKVRKLGDRPYYDPVEFPQVKSAEPAAKP